MALLRTREAVMCLFRPALRGLGVTEQQWRILPDMEKRQLVARKQVDSDLRRSVVSLQPKGLRLIATHAPDSERIYARITERFGEKRVTQLFTLLHELQESLEGIEKP